MAPRRHRPVPRTRLLGCVFAFTTVLFAGCDGGESALARGDRLWADSSYEDALAEYRLAARQSGDDAALLRVAHTYARLGRLAESRRAYDRLLDEAPEHVDQAVYDYLRLAERARRRGDRYGLARAVEAALALRPDLPLQGLSVPLARYYESLDEPERALAFYQRALASAPADSVPALLFAIGRLHEEGDDCATALGYFRASEAQAPEGPAAEEARWHAGSCAFALARAARAEGDPGAALRHLETVLSLGKPETVQDEAWFLRGELLFALGRYDEALEAYRRVLELNPERVGRRVERAQERIDQIRFRSY